VGELLPCGVVRSTGGGVDRTDGAMNRTAARMGGVVTAAAGVTASGEVDADQGPEPSAKPRSSTAGGVGWGRARANGMRSKSPMGAWDMGRPWR